MNPDLVCKIEAKIAGGKKRRGSGYPIGPDRIITAAHVVMDALPDEAHIDNGDARCITLFFGAQGKFEEAPVYLEWCGRDVGVDVAVLRCELPEALQPTHRLWTTPPDTPVEWFAQGYTDFGKEKRPGGKDAYHGWLTKFTATEATVALGCEEGLITAKQWAGGSGSVAFDRETQRALAVITTYQGGKKLDQLVAVPICYVLSSADTQKGFRRAIQFEVYQQRHKYRDDVIGIITLKLQALDEVLLKKVAQEMCEIAGEGASGINLKNNKKELAQDTATCIVNHSAVTNVVGCLIALMADLSHEPRNQLAVIIDHVLPLNYAPDAMHRLSAQLTNGQVGLVENEVATRTLDVHFVNPTPVDFGLDKV